MQLKVEPQTLFELHLEEVLLPELQEIIKSRFPGLVETRITLEGGPDDNGSHIEENNRDGDDTDEEAKGDHIYHCRVLLEFQEPIQVTYCDLAIIRDGEHVSEPWSVEQAEEWKVSQGREFGWWEERRCTVIVHNE